MKNSYFFTYQASSVAVWNSYKLVLNRFRNFGFNYVDNAGESIVDLNSFLTNRKKSFSIINFLNSDMDYAFCPNIYCCLIALLLRPVKNWKIIFWVQGILPEESYMRHKSPLRKIVLEVLEKVSLNKADYLILVSDGMKKFYEDKYSINLSNSVVLPCISEFDIVTNNKRLNNSFVYIGGVSAWQRVDKVIEYFSKYKRLYQDSILHIITQDVESVEKIIASENLEKYILESIKVYTISERKLIPKILGTFQFGFLFRDVNSVNYVSSPIKFAEYLSCGVNVLISNAIPHYSKMVDEFSCGKVVDIGDIQIDKCLNYNEVGAIDLYNCEFSEIVLNAKIKNMIKQNYE